jgi:hypothetical protein
VWPPQLATEPQGCDHVPAVGVWPPQLAAEPHGCDLVPAVFIYHRLRSNHKEATTFVWYGMLPRQIWDGATTVL